MIHPSALVLAFLRDAQVQVSFIFPRTTPLARTTALTTFVVELYCDARYVRYFVFQAPAAHYDAGLPDAGCLPRRQPARQRSLPAVGLPRYKAISQFSMAVNLTLRPCGAVSSIATTGPPSAAL